MQSYRHADTRLQAAQLLYSLATVRNDDFRNRVTLTVDLWVNACRATARGYKSGVDSSSCFPFRARTNIQTDSKSYIFDGFCNRVTF